MKKVHSKKLNKLIICIIAAVMLCNFAVPNFVYAKTDTDDGGKLLKAVAKFVAYLCDRVMQWLQNSFMSMDDIEQEDGTYNYQYSPAIIFSGQVPALDVNFIEPNEDKMESEGGGFTEEKIRNNIQSYIDRAHSVVLDASIEAEAANKFLQERSELQSNSEYKSFSVTTVGGLGVSNTTFVFYKDDEALFYITKITSTFSNPPSSITSYYKYTTNKTISATYESTAAKLQSTISSWYQALRMIALVGLLSVLVYIGIRIVLSSASPQEQSKYKKMMTDWLVALCLLFTLHYIMSFIMTITAEISKIFNTGETDQLLNTLRETIKGGNGTQSWGAVMGEVIMYAALVVFTVMFTIQYVKRVIYMAFFTMIAPLITLTYPLDKIKDGQAQAFTMWIREYTFNALIQIVHLIIYYVLVGSALQLVDVYPLYAIITIMFMKQAENVVRKMFGFDKAETISALGAAATGGLVMNAISSLTKTSKSGGDKNKSQSGEQTKPVRTTATTDPLAGLRRTNSQAGAEGNGGAGTPVRSNETQTPNISEEAMAAFGAGQAPASMPTETATPTGGGAPAQNTNNTKPKRNILNGVSAVFGKYVGPNIPSILRTAGGTFMGLAGGTIGLAAGVAQGDIQSALTGAAAGFAAGGNIGRGLGNGVGSLIDGASGITDPFRGVRQTFREGAYGEEDVSAIMSAGITDEDEIDRILENNDGDISKAIGYYTLAKNCPNEIFNDDNKLEEYLRNLGLSETKAKEMRENMARFR